MKTRKVLINFRYGGYHLPREILDALSVRGRITSYNEKYAIPRDDPDLIAVAELASPEYLEQHDLGIVEIPADVEWQIEEYDGKEWIAETHRTWHYERKL